MFFYKQYWILLAQIVRVLHQKKCFEYLNHLQLLIKEPVLGSIFLFLEDFQSHIFLEISLLFNTTR